MSLSLDRRFNSETVVKAICKRLAAADDEAQLPANVSNTESDKPRIFKEMRSHRKDQASDNEPIIPKQKLKIAVKRKVETLKKKKQKKEEVLDSEDSFDSSDNTKPRRDMQTQAIVKNDRTKDYFLILLNYVMQGDKYLVTLKNITSKKFLCKRQEMPREFALYGVPVEDLDDPTDVFQTLKKRLGD
jgi:hypothetical protein